MQLKRTVVAGVAVALLVGGSAFLAPAVSAEGSSSEDSARSLAKKPSRITTKTGIYSSNDYDFYALGTLYRDGKKYPGKRVVLQAKVEGDWKRIDVAQTTVYGTVRWYFKPSSLRWRLKFGGDKSTHGDRSSTFGFGSGRIAGPDRDADPAELVTLAR